MLVILLADYSPYSELIDIQRSLTKNNNNNKLRGQVIFVNRLITISGR